MKLIEEANGYPQHSEEIFPKCFGTPELIPAGQKVEVIRQAAGRLLVKTIDKKRFITGEKGYLYCWKTDATELE
jgi:hypothetical protein